MGSGLQHSKDWQDHDREITYLSRHVAKLEVLTTKILERLVIRFNEIEKRLEALEVTDDKS